MSRSNCFEIVAGDNLPLWSMVLPNTNIAGYTIILQIQEDPNTSPTNVSGTIVDAASGSFQFQLPTTLSSGLHPCTVVTDDGTGGIESHRGFYLKVLEAWA